MRPLHEQFTACVASVKVFFYCSVRDDTLRSQIYYLQVGELYLSDVLDRSHFKVVKCQKNEYSANSLQGQMVEVSRCAPFPHRALR
jgi:hypothetical protein